MAHGYKWLEYAKMRQDIKVREIQKWKVVEIEIFQVEKCVQLVGGIIAIIGKEEMRASDIDSLVYFNAKFLGEDGGKNWMYSEKSIYLLPLSLLGNTDTEAEEKNEKSTFHPHYGNKFE